MVSAIPRSELRRARRRSRPRNTRGLGPGRVGFPLVDMSETRLLTRSG